VCEIKPFSQCTGKATGTRKIIKAPFEKANTGNYFAIFEPVSPQLLERLER